MRHLNEYWAGMLAWGAVGLTAACNESRETGRVTSRSGGDTSSAPAAEAVEERDHALIRAVNAIPGQAAITIYAGDSAAFKDVSYKKATGYEEIPDDRFNFQLKAGDAPQGEAVASNRENLQDGGHYTVVALPSEDPDDQNLRVLDDDLKPITDGKARVRFINGLAGDTDVDLFVRGQEDPMFDGVNFKAEAGWKEVAPTSGTLVVKPDNEDATLATLASAKLEAGKSYTFVLVGKAGKYDLVKIEDAVAVQPNQ
jgi:hypothetical protein